MPRTKEVKRHDGYHGQDIVHTTDPSNRRTNARGRQQQHRTGPGTTGGRQQLLNYSSSSSTPMDDTNGTSTSTTTGARVDKYQQLLDQATRTMRAGKATETLQLVAGIINAAGSNSNRKGAERRPARSIVAQAYALAGQANMKEGRVTTKRIIVLVMSSSTTGVWFCTAMQPFMCSCLFVCLIVCLHVRV
jgi:hypothetical protein